jgi:hypothetical protein
MTIYYAYKHILPTKYAWEVRIIYNFIVWPIRGSLLFCGITNVERAFTKILETEIMHHRSKLVIIAAAQ